MTCLSPTSPAEDNVDAFFDGARTIPGIHDGRWIVGAGAATAVLGSLASIAATICLVGRVPFPRVVIALGMGGMIGSLLGCSLLLEKGDKISEQRRVEQNRVYDEILGYLRNPPDLTALLEKVRSRPLPILHSKGAARKTTQELCTRLTWLRGEMIPIKGAKLFTEADGTVVQTWEVVSHERGFLPVDFHLTTTWRLKGDDLTITHPPSYIDLFALRIPSLPFLAPGDDPSWKISPIPPVRDPGTPLPEGWYCGGDLGDSPS